MDTAQYLGVFLDEAKEHLQTLNDSIMQLEQEPDSEDCINEIFRAAHSMKGMAGTMGYKRMQDLTHHIEDVFSDVRNGALKVDSNMVDILFQSLDAVQAYVDNITETQDEGTEENEHLIKALSDIRSGGGKAGGDAAAEAAPAEGGEAGPEMVDPSDDSAAWTHMKLDPQVKEHCEEESKGGKKLYGMTIHIQESCVLKAARAFLVFKGLEEAEDQLAYLDEKLTEVIDPQVISDLRTVIESVDGVKEADFRIVFDPTIVRGMGYYTGTIFEIAMPELGISCGGGGRYDAMVGKFTGKDVPACGFSIGFERIILILMEQGFKIPGSPAKVAFLLEKNLPADRMKEAMQKAQQERAGGRQVLLARMAKNKKFQKQQLRDRGYEEFEEFYTNPLK